ncbi:Gfo/Idh/MocA family protein [Cohnella sp. REN36]|uniref:Gfo/Idh/MocA family protein n=1 Tax=Cohnella sp. REN36 TaxID=2887347 RepID=UPI001D14A614|nr:Gfo/Idh/MocA family oxidoreductase [Cohnella sp. REN36]MCC3374702.1 Gfo/Idh/MocA family oxidoreductase [Cohnella sp. REN36]
MKLGIIGYGLRMKTVVGEILRHDPSCRIAGILDPGAPEASDRGAPVPRYDTLEALLEGARPDGLLIGTRCSLHTPYALQALPTGIPLYMEKPVATTMEDWTRLYEASRTYNTPVVVSHPLRLTAIVQLVKEIVDAGTIGTIEHVQAVNNVPYGGVYYHSWYRDEAETGGMFLQKATHDFDYINYVLGQDPAAVCAMTSKQVFKGNKPAGLRCADCEENRTCAESTVGTPEAEEWPFCCFAEDTGNEDSGSALIRYESGMHVSYTQNFFARRGAAARGATFLGYKGTISFDFVTGEVVVHHHHSPRMDRYRYNESEGHFGGDTGLAANFVDVMRGKGTSVSTLRDGLVSALLCLKAKEAQLTGMYQELGELRAASVSL